MGTADESITVLTAAGVTVPQKTEGLVSFKEIKMKGDSRNSLYALTRCVTPAAVHSLSASHCPAYT
jgi:hypothetical protein